MIKDKTIFIKNIYYMLSYAFISLNKSVYEDIKKEEFDNIHNLFASILEKGISKQLKQGLYREYNSYQEDLFLCRGKINIDETFKNYSKRKMMLNCEYDELTIDNIYNQILKSTMALLIKCHDVDEKYKDNLKKEMFSFAYVKNISPSKINWSMIRFHKNNISYRMLISVCQLIIEGMLLTTEKGEYRLNSFIDDQQMSRLYEKFILEYYIKEYPILNAKASQIDWAIDDENKTMLPMMQSDVTLTKGNKILIIDAKYYAHVTQNQYNVHTIHSNNLYQIFTYVKNKQNEHECEKKIVSGLLLYAMTDEEIQPDVTYRMSGNKIAVKTLNLNCDFKEIAHQLNSIVEEYFY